MDFKYNYDRMLVVGRSGSGKTTFVHYLLKNVPKYIVLTQKIDDLYPKKHIRILNDDIDKSINDFISEGIRKAPITLVFEDLPSYLYSSKLPKLFRYVLINGRHIGIGLIFISQRFYTIPVLVRVQSNLHVYFASALGDYNELPDSIKNMVTPLKQYEYIMANYDTGQISINKK